MMPGKRSGCGKAKKRALGGERNWSRVAQAYARRPENEDGTGEAYLTSVAKMHEGTKVLRFFRTMEVY